MRAVFKRELQSYFYTATAYVYMGVFLALGSVFFALGNLAAHSGDLPGFLWNMGYLWMLLTPILTMHTYAGERKSRTDQALFSAPVSLAGIVGGKYLAGCAVLGLTVALSLVYPLVIGLYGRLYLGETLCAYAGFVLQGCAFLAVDQLISARCRTPVTAAVWAFGVNLLLWLTDVASSAVGVVWVQKALSFLSLYMRAAPFQQGQGSLANTLYFLAVIGLCLFVTLRSLDARRWSGKPRRTLAGAGLCALAAGVAVAAVLTADALESRYALRADLSFNRVTTRSEATDRVLSELDQDVHAYAVASAGNELNDLEALLDRYQAATAHFTWSRENLSQNPLLLKWVSDDVNDSAVTTDCVILRCEATDRTRVLTWEDYMRFSYDADTGSYAWTGLTYEEALTGAILYVSADELRQVQILTGHGELTAAETAALEDTLRRANYAVERVNLQSGDALDPAAPLLVLSPTRDITVEETDALLAFAQAGGGLLVTADFTDPDELPNLYAFYRLYGVTPRPGLVLADAGHGADYYTNTAELTPRLLAVADVTEGMVQGGADFLILAPARALETVGAASADLVLSTVLESGEGSYLKRVTAENLATDRQPEDPVGPFPLAVLSDRAFGDGTRSRAFFIGNSGLFTDETVLGLTCSGELLVQVTAYLMGREAFNLDILPRQALRPALNAGGSALPVVLLVLPVLLVAACAVAVLTPRRYL